MSEFERLKQLLLAEERAELARQGGLLDDAARARADLPSELPDLIERAQTEAGPGRLSQALAEPMAEALAAAVRSRRQMIVDALFPVIGPAIRKAIAEYLRNFVEGFNRALEASLTPRGLRWRFEAWRTGVPYGQVVLKHTLRFRVDHVFLIERDSGLVIHRESAPDLPDLDSDAIAGMLTAIGEFVKDSVGRDTQGSLESARVGEHVMWLIEGPRASLASFIRGMPPPALHAALERRLEEIHARFNDPLAQLQAGAANVDALLEEQLDLAAIERDGRNGEDPPATKSSNRLAHMALAALIVLVFAWLLRDWLWARRIERVSAQLRDWPGLYLESTQSRPFRSVRLRGLIDPLADSPVAALAAGELKGYAIELDLRPYVSADPEILVRRARAVLQAPADVHIAVDDGALRISGVAAADWSAAVEAKARLIAGVREVDTSGLAADVIGAIRATLGVPDGVALSIEGGALHARGVASVEWIQQLQTLLSTMPAVSEQDFSALSTSEALELDVIARRLADTDIDFASGQDIGNTPDASGIAPLTDLRRALELSRKLDRPLRARTFGLTDEVGSDEFNAGLRLRRANWLAETLRREVPGLQVEPVQLDPTTDPRATLKRRAARVLLDQPSTAP